MKIVLAKATYFLGVGFLLFALAMTATGNA